MILFILEFVLGLAQTESSSSCTATCTSTCPSTSCSKQSCNDSKAWDGKECGLIEKACCQAPGLPWFHKTLNSPTTDYIEMRVCGDHKTNDEDSPVGYYEIYVK